MSLEWAITLGALVLALVLWDLGRRHYAVRASVSASAGTSDALERRIAELERSTTERFEKTAYAMANLDRKHAARQPSARGFANRL